MPGRHRQTTFSPSTPSPTSFAKPAFTSALAVALTNPRRSITAGTLGIGLVLSSMCVPPDALAQPESPQLPTEGLPTEQSIQNPLSEPASETARELPLFGRVRNRNYEPPADAGQNFDKPLTPEQQAAVDNSPLNSLPLSPQRSPEAGTLVSKEEGRLMVDNRLWNANTYRYHYNSTDSMGNPSVDTAIYVEPKTPWPGSGPRPVVAIAPGTQGAAEYCDPSIALQTGPYVRIDPFDVVFPYEFIPLAAHLARGAAVVMIDHHRNANGNQDYVDNIVAAQSLLDATQAAQELGIDADAPVGIYGYSQGGSAAAAAAERAAIYAPELNVVATSAGGPPSDLQMVLESIDGSKLTGVSALAINSVLDKDPALKEALRSELNPIGAEAIEDAGNYCNLGLNVDYGYEVTEQYTKDNVSLSQMIGRFPPVQRELERQKVGNFVPSAPVFLYNAVNDDLIPIEQARALRDSWLALGFDELTWHEDPTPPISDGQGINHILGMLNNLDQATNFIWDHFPSQPAPQNLAL